MRWGAFAFFTAIVISSVHAAPVDLEHSSPSVKAVVSAVQKMEFGPAWDSINIDADETSFTFTLNYKVSPGYRQLVEADTKKIARLALQQLVKSGRSPSREQIIVIVIAQRRIKGETGTNQTVTYGVTAYRPSEDELRFEFNWDLMRRP